MSFSYHILAKSTDQWVIAFYGFGQQKEVFVPLAKKLAKKFSFVVIDIPLQENKHGNHKKHFAKFLQDLIEKYKIQHVTGISYSMGSRFNFCMLEAIPSYIRRAIFVAPDGIKIRYWNRLATETYIGHALFSYFVHHPTAYLALIGFLHQIKLLPDQLYAFSKWHMRDEMARKKVYHAWMNMRKIIPDWSLIQQQVATYQPSLCAYFGQKDQVIKLQYANLLHRKLPSTEIIRVNKGHNLLDEELFDDIANKLLN